MLKQRTFTWMSQGKPQTKTINYKLSIVNGQLYSIINENGYSVEKTSECWDYFTKNQ